MALCRRVFYLALHLREFQRLVFCRVWKNASIRDHDVRERPVSDEACDGALDWMLK